MTTGRSARVPEPNPGIKDAPPQKAHSSIDGCVFPHDRHATCPHDAVFPCVARRCHGTSQLPFVIYSMLRLAPQLSQRAENAATCIRTLRRHPSPRVRPKEMPKSLLSVDGREHTSLAVAESQGVRASGGTCGAMPKGV